MKILHLYLKETTVESFYHIRNQERWKDDIDNLQLNLSDDTKEICLDLSGVISESGQKLLGLKFRHGLYRNPKEGIILLEHGIAVIPIDRLTSVYPIWGSKYQLFDDEVKITRILHKDEIGYVVQIEYNIETPYGNVPIFTKITGEIIFARHLDPAGYYSLYNKRIYPASFETVRVAESGPLQREIKKRICI